MILTRGDEILVSLALTIWFALVDITFIDHILKPMNGPIHAYHIAFFWVLIPVVASVVAYDMNDIRIAPYTVLYCNFGLVDILYYVLRGMIPPASLPWLWFTTSRRFLAGIVIVLFSLTVWWSLRDRRLF